MLSFKRATCCVKTSCESYLVSTPIFCPSPPWEGWGVSHLKRSRVLVGKFEFNTLRWSIRACLELYLTQDTTWNGNDSVLLFVQRGNEQYRSLHMGFPFFWVLSCLLLLGIFIYILRSCLCILKYSKICFTLNCKPIISSASWKISRLIYKKFFLFFFQAQFRNVPWDLNSVVVFRLYLQPGDLSTSGNSTAPAANLLDESKLAAWTALPLALTTGSQASRRSRQSGGDYFCKYWELLSGLMEKKKKKKGQRELIDWKFNLKLLCILWASLLPTRL